MIQPRAEGRNYNLRIEKKSTKCAKRSPKHRKHEKQEHAVELATTAVHDGKRC